MRVYVRVGFGRTVNLADAIHTSSPHGREDRFSLPDWTEARCASSALGTLPVCLARPRDRRLQILNAPIRQVREVEGDELVLLQERWRWATNIDDQPYST